MLPRPPACRGAVQKQLSTTIESIWVSDDILRQEWQRFVGGCRTGRRFGSFVPGPLESRRRMGKRRIAHLSEALPPKLHGIASLWGSFWEVDRSQWQWHAPRNRNSKDNDTTRSQELSNWREERRRLVEAVPKLRAAVRPTIHEDINSFRRRLKECQLNELSTICDDFNKLFRHNLSLGLLSDIETVRALRGVSNDLHATFPSAAAPQCLSFYAATWEGIVACKVLPIEQMGSLVPTVLLKLLSRLPIALDMSAVASSIISRLSTSQLESSTQATCSIVDRLVVAWLQDCSVQLQSSSYPPSKQRPISSACCGLEKRPIRRASARRLHRTHISSLKLATLKLARESAEEIRIADALVPSKIGEILRYLPRDTIKIIIRNGSQSVAQFYKSRKSLPTDIRYSWLLLVSQFSTSRIVFRTILKLLEAVGTLENQKLMSIIVLRHWTTQGWVTYSNLFEREFRNRVSKRPDTGFGVMIYLLERRQEKVWIEKGQLFEMLLDIGQFSTVYNTISQMKTQGVTMPMKLGAQIVEAVSKYSPVLAFRMFEQCVGMRLRHERMFLEYCPNFVVSMIHNPRVHPRRIWGFLRVRVYGELSRQSRSRFMCANRSTMSPAMANLITSMVIAFANCRTRSPGVVLRNVTQCLQHLRRHRASLSPLLTRAITHASINLRIEFDRLVPQERAEWALRIIRNVEGPKVAETVAMIIDVWNDHKRMK